MKKINKIFLYVLLAVFISGCEDAIDIEQPGRLGAEQAFQTVADLQLGLLGAYGFIDSSQEIQFNAVFTDEVAIGFDNGGQGLGNGEYGFILNPGSAFATTWWRNNYVALNAVNRVIEASTLITPEASEQSDFNNILGQAYALRGYLHFQLLSYLSTDYTDDSALATIIVNFVPTIDQNLPRNTNGEVFAAITSDLDQADGLLNTQSNSIFVSRDFVTAVRARMAAYRGQYSQADGFAASLLGSYNLADQGQYEAMYEDLDNTEVIFKLSRTLSDIFNRQGTTGSAQAGGWAGANFAFVNSTLDGSPYYEMGRSLFNILDPTDVRYTVTVDATSVIDPDYQINADPALDILVISKYPGKDGRPLMNDLKIFRASEMVMIRAEAAADANDLAGAAAFIKQIRDARFGADTTAPVYASQQEAFADILDERRREFMYEGHRYKDLKRLGARANRGVERDAIDCAVNGACSLSVTDFRFSMPVPLVELNANDNIQQNPGY